MGCVCVLLCVLLCVWGVVEKNVPRLKKGSKLNEDFDSSFMNFAMARALLPVRLARRLWASARLPFEAKLTV